MESETRLPDLETDPKHGFYPWWPQDGDGWVHPEDVAEARRLIPSPRIWRRDGEQGEYVVLHYGELRLRVKHTLWREAPSEGFEVGDQVEVLPHGMSNEHFTGVIREMHWDAHEGAVRYFIEAAGGGLYDRELGARDLKHVESPKPQEEGRIEPSGEGEELGLME